MIRQTALVIIFNILIVNVKHCGYVDGRLRSGTSDTKKVIFKVLEGGQTQWQ